MESQPVITLTTDFGTADGFAGALKGVLSRLAPTARLVDITHEIPPYDRTAAIFALRTATPHFAPNTVHLVVIDPGVGSSRRGLIVRAGEFWFVGPDNGILTGVLPQPECYAIRMDRFLSAAPTFHGRDVFAPAAAALARGEPLQEWAERISDPVRYALPLASRIGNLVRGEVVHVDRFGNLISNIPRKAVEEGAQVAVSIDGKPVKFARTFSDVEPGEAVAYWGSAGLLEIAVREGDARARIGGKGLPVEVLRYA